MKKRSIGIGLAVSALAGLTAALVPIAPAKAAGADLTIHNDTGTDVDVYIAEGENAKHGDKGEVKGAHIKNGEHATGHVTLCKFHVFLVHGEDVYHKQFTDCSITDIHIGSDRKGK
jgi:hypothetical protein